MIDIKTGIDISTDNDKSKKNVALNVGVKLLMRHQETIFLDGVRIKLIVCNRRVWMERVKQ